MSKTLNKDITRNIGLRSLLTMTLTNLIVQDIEITFKSSNLSKLNLSLNNLNLSNLY
jgi:hypothetical protein